MRPSDDGRLPQHLDPARATALDRLRYPWVHDPQWQSPHQKAHGHDYMGGPVDAKTGACRLCPDAPDYLRKSIETDPATCEGERL
jgi:hypothetical protein